MQNHFNGKAGRIGVAVLAKYALVSNAIKSILESSRDIAVVGAAHDAEALAALVRARRPQVVILCGARGEDHAALIREVRAVSPASQVIILTDPDEPADHTEVVKLGVAGIVELNQHARVLIRAVEQVADGETWLSQKLVARLVGGERRGANGQLPSQPKGDALTTRELEVIAMIGRGMKNKEISQQMFISEATVRHHLSTVYSKLRIDDRLNLVIYAYQHNLIRHHDAIPAVIPAHTSAGARAAFGAGDR